MPMLIPLPSRRRRRADRPAPAGAAARRTPARASRTAASRPAGRRSPSSSPSSPARGLADALAVMTHAPIRPSRSRAAGARSPANARVAMRGTSFGAASSRSSLRLQLRAVPAPRRRKARRTREADAGELRAAREPGHHPARDAARGPVLGERERRGRRREALRLGGRQALGLGEEHRGQSARARARRRRPLRARARAESPTGPSCRRSPWSGPAGTPSRATRCSSARSGSTSSGRARSRIRRDGVSHPAL